MYIKFNNLKKNLKVLVFLLCFIHSMSLYPQMPINSDSLMVVFKKDKTDLESLSLLAQSFEHKNIIDARRYAHLLIKSAKKKDYEFISRAFNTLANCDLIENKLDSAEKNYKKAITFSNKGGHKKNVAVYQSSLAQIYLNKGELKKAISYYELSLKNLNSLKNETVDFYVAVAYGGLGDTYSQSGLYNDALEKLFLSLKINKKIDDPISIAITYNSIASVFDNLNQIENSKKNNLKALDFITKANYPLAEATILLNLAENHYKLNTINESLMLLTKAEKILVDNNTDYNLGNVNQLFGDIYKKQNDLKTALLYYEKALNQHFKDGRQLYYGQAKRKVGEINYLLGNKIAGKKMITDAIQIFDKENMIKEKKDALEVLLNLLSKTKDYDNFDFIFNSYLETDKAYLDEEKQKSITSHEIKYETELKESQIKTQQLQLEKEKTNRNLALMGGGLLFVIAGGGLWYFKNKQKQVHLQTQNTLLGLQQELNHKELENLNKQLDPHEIKNLLASISPEIQDKAPEAYKKMIKLFKITKASLNNTLTEPLDKQLEQIDDFLSLEKNMLSEPLHYAITNNTKNENLEIPRLLLKNLVENAIKHGIKGKTDGGNINVEVNQDNQFINISIDDTGKGRLNAISLDSGIGTTTYQKLFATLNQKNKLPATFNIIDKTQGTKVEVKIPLDYKYT